MLVDFQPLVNNFETKIYREKYHFTDFYAVNVDIKFSLSVSCHSFKMNFILYKPRDFTGNATNSLTSVVLDEIQS